MGYSIWPIFTAHFCSFHKVVIFTQLSICWNLHWYFSLPFFGTVWDKMWQTSNSSSPQAMPTKHLVKGLRAVTGNQFRHFSIMTFLVSFSGRFVCFSHQVTKTLTTTQIEIICHSMFIIIWHDLYHIYYVFYSVYEHIYFRFNQIEIMCFQINIKCC